MFPHTELPDPSCNGLASPLEYEARVAPRRHLKSHWRYRLLMRLEECALRARAACIACFPCRAHTGMPEPFCAISLLLLPAPARIMWGVAPPEPGPRRPGSEQGGEQRCIVRHAPGPKISLSTGWASRSSGSPPRCSRTSSVHDSAAHGMGFEASSACHPYRYVWTGCHTSAKGRPATSLRRADLVPLLYPLSRASAICPEEGVVGGCGYP